MPTGVCPTELPDDHSECEPPDPISNSEVKVLSADGSVGSPHVRVGHRQALKYTNPKQNVCLGFCALWDYHIPLSPLGVLNESLLKMMKYIVSGVVIVCVLSYFLISTKPSADFVSYSSDAAAVERGRYLVIAGGCLSCHQNPERSDSMSGGLALATQFGTFYVPNITPDAATGIGGWTPEDFILALKHGRRPDGGYYFPAFPFRAYAALSDQEVLDMWSFLMSLSPEEHAVQDHELPVWLDDWMMAGWNLIADSLESPVQEFSDPQVARGAKLARNLGHCGECHTPRNAIGIPIAGREFAGATMGESHADAIDQEALQGWSANDFAFFLFLGMKPDEEYVGGEMEAVIAHNTSQLSEEDRQAMAAFFKFEGPR